MIFNPILEEAILLRRYRRFLADIETLEGEKLTIHCANTGSMMNCMKEGGRIWFERSRDPSRKTHGSWILSETPHGRLACINTHLANRLVEEALVEGVIKEVAGFSQLRREVPYGAENSRIDFCLDYDSGTTAYIEVKSVTLGFSEDSIAAFPDAVTARGTKHLRELSALAKEGIPTYLLYCVNLTDITGVRVAREIDAKYADELEKAKEKGVKIIAYGTELTPKEIKVMHSLTL